jgi:hypothetical protein
MWNQVLHVNRMGVYFWGTVHYGFAVTAPDAEVLHLVQAAYGISMHDKAHMHVLHGMCWPVCAGWP